MLFPTFTFALFFVVVLTVGWLMPGRRAWWKLFMLAASYVFYGYWDARFVGLIVASTVLNQAAAASLGHLQHPRRPAGRGEPRRGSEPGLAWVLQVRRLLRGQRRGPRWRASASPGTCRC